MQLETRRSIEVPSIDHDTSSSCWLKVWKRETGHVKGRYSFAVCPPWCLSPLVESKNATQLSVYCNRCVPNNSLSDASLAQLHCLSYATLVTVASSPRHSTTSRTRTHISLVRLGPALRRCRAAPLARADTQALATRPSPHPSHGAW